MQNSPKEAGFRRVRRVPGPECTTERVVTSYNAPDRVPKPAVIGSEPCFSGKIWQLYFGGHIVAQCLCAPGARMLYHLA